MFGGLKIVLNQIRTFTFCNIYYYEYLIKKKDLTNWKVKVYVS